MPDAASTLAGEVDALYFYLVGVTIFFTLLISSVIIFFVVKYRRRSQFAHASGIMILTPQGKISRYFYGIEYAPKDVRLSLIEASGGKIGSSVDKILLYCYHYDPATGKYAWVMNIYRLGGILTVLGMIALFFVLRRRNFKRVDSVELGGTT